MVTSTWTIDASRSGIHFSVRHLAISRVRGKFTRFSGTLELDEADLTKSKVDISIDVASVDTGDDTRDTHLRSGDFFDVGKFGSATFKSKSVTMSGGEYIVKGDFTVRGVTRELDLNATFEGKSKDPRGGERAAFQAKTSISREDYGMTFNMPLEYGAVLVGTKIDLELEVQAVRSEVSHVRKVERRLAAAVATSS